MMVVRDNIHAVTVGTSAVICEQRKARAIRARDIESKLVCLPSAQAHARERDVPVACAAQDLLELGIELEDRLRGEVRTRADVDALKATAALLQHERLAPGQ